MSNETLVQLATLFARDGRGAVNGLSLTLPAGADGALLGSPADGTTALASALCGAIAPRAGDLTIAGERPASSPSVRSRIGALLDDPPLPDVGRVRDLLVFARMLRGTEAPRDEWYDPLRMGELDTTPLARLDRLQRRTVALALALAVSSPLLVVLYEPLCDVLHVQRDALRGVLRKRAAQGACVLVLTASVRDASSLVDDVATLQRGRLGRAIGAPDLDELAPGSEIELQVWSDLPRVLASALVLEPSLQAVSWAADNHAPVVVRCRDLDAAAVAIARVASSNGASVQAIRPVIPSLGEVNAASAGLALAARYQAAYRAAANTSPPRREP